MPTPISRIHISDIKNASLPSVHDFGLPEKVLQFGTGVLLRGLVDYFIQEANTRGIFNGRVVVIKSTAQGELNAFKKQDGLYTICVRGLENGKLVSENRICAAISRVLSADFAWAEILHSVHNRELQIIVSNTTEVGLRLEEESIFKNPPRSYPAKLLALLYERYKFFHADRSAGFVIIPTELIPDNGALLCDILLRLAHFNLLEADFVAWLTEANVFCSSLVDRIVPGKPLGEEKAALENDLGFSDELALIAEPYRLWAIAGDEKIKSICSFHEADAGVIISSDITPYRELKLRLLNGTHTLTCGLAHLAGFTTVKEGMADKVLSNYIRGLMQEEILPVLPPPITEQQAREFASRVLERFANPFIEHPWLSITLQYSSKMRMRNIPILLNHYKKHNGAPKRIALGFAAYILFMKAVKFEDRVYYGKTENGFYPIRDDEASYFMDLWHRRQPEEIVRTVLANQSLWGTDLCQLPGFANLVVERLRDLMRRDGPNLTLAS